MGFRLSELERKLNNIIRYGTIEKIDHSVDKVQIRSGEILTNWIKYFVASAGNTKQRTPASIGEQGVILSPSGDLSQGSFIVGLSFNNSPQVSDSNSDTVWDVEGDFILNVGGQVMIVAPNNVNVIGDVIADGVSLEHHTHGGIKSGPSSTGEPN